MALKIVYPICCGIDVHKSFVVACIASTNDKGVTSYKRRRFSTFTGDLRRLAGWLASNNCKDVCMESTGKYWIPVFNILEQTCNVVLAHPKYVKAIRGKKTDKRDAQWIADIFKHDLVKGGRACWSIDGGNNLARLLTLKHTKKLHETLAGLTNWVLPAKYAEEVTVKMTPRQIPMQVGKGYDGRRAASFPSKPEYKWLRELGKIKPEFSL